LRRKLSRAVVLFGLCFDVLAYGGIAALALEAHREVQAKHAPKESGGSIVPIQGKAR
jgi:hypothetical protein